MSYRLKGIIEIEFDSDKPLSITSHHVLENIFERENIEIKEIFLCNASDGLKIKYK